VTRCLATAGVLLLAGCEGDSVGVCSHTYRDPLLTIARVTDTRTGRAIARVVLRDLTLDGRPIPPSVLVGGGPTVGASATDSAVVCDVRCGFATTPGRYGFTVTAAGYRPAGLVVAAEYARTHLGCPSWSEGSREVTVRLEPAP
jgi:hypothetical protein